jgi:hypothetical protein
MQWFIRLNCYVLIVGPLDVESHYGGLLSAFYVPLGSPWGKNYCSLYSRIFVRKHGVHAGPKDYFVLLLLVCLFVFLFVADVTPAPVRGCWVIRGADSWVRQPSAQFRHSCHMRVVYWYSAHEEHQPHYTKYQYIT